MAWSLTSWLLFLGAACASNRVESEKGAASDAASGGGASSAGTAKTASANGASNTALLEEARARMVREQLEARGVRDARVLAAMREVPRHQFVPADVIREAYDDTPLPIGHDQTISQPYIVALMTELARPRPADRAPEIGTGSGYQAAVLSRVVGQVFTIEYVPALARSAAKALAAYPNIVVREGDGYGGWPEHGPYDIILVTAAPETLPPALVDQLAPGGRLVIPIGATSATQELKLIQKREDGTVTTESITPVRFVPLVGGR
jgi:protein-L-isoaspartate(D-aspartate) O-methyltransferase